MDNNGKIYITISDNQIRGSGNGNENKKTEAQKKSELLTHQLNSFLINNSKSILNYSFNNIGNFTGDYNAQRTSQNMWNIASGITNIGIAFASGGIVGGALAIASTGINFALKEYSDFFEIKKQNYQIGQLKDISGLNGLTNGSR